MAAVHEDRNAQLSPGVAIKAPCRAATTAAITLSGEQTVDGVALVSGDRCLVKNQASSVDNGIYDVDTGSWDRSPDFDGNRDVVHGTLVFIVSGANNANSAWECTVTDPIVFGSSNVTFTQAALGPNDAVNISFLQAGAGAVPRTLQNKDRDIISAADFGMLPAASAATNTSALALIATAINALGGATLVFPPGTYNVNGRTDDGALCAFSSLAGLTIIAGGATIADQTTYTGTQQGLLFKFTDCSNYSVKGLKITTQNVGVNLRGLHGFYSTGTCKDFELDWEQTGGFIGCNMVRAVGDPLTSRCSCYKVRAKLTNVHYGIAGQFSGDNGQVQLDTDGSFRDFIFYGAAHVNFDINSKNPNSTSLVQSFSGFGCSDIGLNLHDRESTSHIDLPRVQVGFGDQTAATHRDIRLHFDIANVAGSSGVPFFSFFKLTNGGAADTTGRGHQLLGFEISGNSDNIPGGQHVGPSSEGGLMSLTGTPDVVKNIRVRDFICTGATVDDDWSFLAGVLTDTMVFDHVNVGARSLVVGNATHGRVLFKDCVAATFNANLQGSTTFGPNGGSWELLEAKVATGLSNVDFTLTADYDEYVVDFITVVPTTDDSALQSRVSDDGGGTYKAGATDYRYAYNITTDAAANAPTGSAGTTQFQLSGGISGTLGDGGLNGRIHIYNALSSVKKHVKWDIEYYRSVGPVFNNVNGAGRFNLGTGPITNIRFFPSGAGTFANGRFKLYGVRFS